MNFLSGEFFACKLQYLIFLVRGSRKNNFIIISFEALNSKAALNSKSISRSQQTMRMKKMQSWTKNIESSDKNASKYSFMHGWNVSVQNPTKCCTSFFKAHIIGQWAYMFLYKWDGKCPGLSNILYILL